MYAYPLDRAVLEALFVPLAVARRMVPAAPVIEALAVSITVVQHTVPLSTY